MSTQLDRSTVTAGVSLPPAVDDRVTIIQPLTRRRRVGVRELWRYRELLGIFVWRDLAVRYKQTSVGVLWAIFQPVLMAIVYSAIFGRFAKFPSGTVFYPVFVFGGLLPMLMFNSALTSGAICLVTNVNLITKVYFPRVILPLAAALTPLVDFVLGFIVLIGLMLYTDQLPESVGAALVTPVWVVLTLLAVLGPILLLSAINVRYRDVPYVIPVFLQVLPLISGVPYVFTDELPVHWQWILSLNPMTTVIAGFRWSMFGTPPPELGHALLGLSVAIILLVAGSLYFRRAEPSFADQI